MKEMDDWKSVDCAVDEMISTQKDALLRLARRLIPGLTSEDILQPNDYPELESHADFRYEEGVLAGMQSVQSALRAMQREFFQKR